MRNQLIFIFFFLFFFLFFSCNNEDFLLENNSKKNFQNRNNYFLLYRKNIYKYSFFKNSVSRIIKAPLDGEFIIFWDMRSSNIKDKKKKYNTIIYGLGVFINDSLKYENYFKDFFHEDKKILSQLDLKGNFGFKIPVKKNDKLYLKYFIKNRNFIPSSSLYFYENKNFLSSEWDHIKIYFNPY